MNISAKTCSYCFSLCMCRWADNPARQATLRGDVASPECGGAQDDDVTGAGRPLQSR